jgi:predicted nuclease with TOPRIM domain
VAALLAALANFGVSGTVETEKQTAWLKKHNEELRKSTEDLKKYNERLRRATKSSQEQRRVREEQRNVEAERQRLEERERAARRAAIQNRWIVLQTRHQLAPGEQTQAALEDFLLFLQEYGE